jgi:hypothetical protein
MIRDLVKKSLIGATAFATAFFGPVALADHAWSTYHWARTANPFTLQVGDNLTAQWDAHLATAAADWTLSSVVDMVVVPGTTSPKTCKPTAGKVQVCNSKYGRNGWLGIASVWASGSHITQGTVKLNDTYYSTAQYNTPAWRNLVMCQEIGHTIGLDHQDETFSNPNLGTCMDYTNSPESNQHPNLHDYEMLETIYEHLDATTTVAALAAAQMPDVDAEDPKNWGKELRKSADGRASLFENDLGNGRKLFTHVFWADPERAERGHQE